MYLEKLETQGFKSFANKNVLVFPGMLDKTKRGITAIVGPNGSGKSNVADAVRWVLGEQSMKTLRGKKSEDVIFSGSDKKNKLGMAEASLFLNNEDRKAPLDYSQIILTRRLYRNGDSEYLINNSRVRLLDIQMLLAKASFGQKTYSVIGQGMVEGFLNTSLAERKEFFDEATGVKQYQIKRDESLNKLRGSYENLNQASMLISEIEPRLNSLTRQVNKLKKRGALENELKELQTAYYSKIWHENYDKFNEYNRDYLEKEKIKIEREKKLKQLNEELIRLENQNKSGNDFHVLQKELSDAQEQKNILIGQIAKLDAQMEFNLESQGKFDVSWLLTKKTETEKKIKNIDEEIRLLESKQKQNNLDDLMAEKAKLDKKINELNNQFLNLSGGRDANHEIKKMNTELESLFVDLESLEKESELEKIKEIVKKIKTKITELLKKSKNENSGAELEKTHKELMELANEKEILSGQINELNLENSALKERLKLLKNEKEETQKEFENLQEKISGQKNQIDLNDLQKKKNDLNKDLETLEKTIEEIRKKTDSISQSEEKEREHLFALQRSLHVLQNEINGLSNNLNEIKISSTRYETKLEDLEREIRENLGGLADVKAKKTEGKINEEEAREKINNLKRQLEQIGGIDPEIENEYLETKERYDFLSGQANDLKNGIHSLEKIIKELDIIIKERFDKEFKIIQEKFQEYFKILFNGGSAKIIKVMETEEKEKKTEKELEGEGFEKEKLAKEPEELVDLKKIKFLQKHNATGLAGIEIQATPPGKKITSIAMLSGGERALTAIAMICAIISANPSPFVVLDEVDAALDEANSERLAKILDDLSHKTQFIVITHNRASMHRANVLYGVTMGDDGISKILSVKIDGAKTD